MNQFLKSINLTNGAVVGGVFATITTADVAGCGTVTSVALTPPAAGITVSGSPVTGAGTFVMALANDLAALEAMAGTGLVSRTGTETYAQRTITGTANRVSVSNGDGVSANPTLDIAATYVGQTSITTLGTVGAGVWQGTSIATTFTDAKLKTLTGTTNRITIGGTATDPTVDVSTGYVGQATITTLGTITTGTWHGTIVGTLYGGTGLDCSAAANGKLLIGNGGGFTLASLTAGTGITITPGAGSITIAASGGGGGMAIGDPVSGGTNTYVLFVDGSGNLAQSAFLTFDSSGKVFTVIGAEAGNSAIFVQSGVSFRFQAALANDNAGSGYAGWFHDNIGPHTVTICDGTNNILYGATAPGNWAGSAPTDVWVALDRIAAALTTLGLSP